jgi:hypothetical protein
LVPLVVVKYVVIFLSCLSVMSEPLYVVWVDKIRVASIDRRKWIIETCSWVDARELSLIVRLAPGRDDI